MVLSKPLLVNEAGDGHSLLVTVGAGGFFVAGSAWYWNQPCYWLGFGVAAPSNGPLSVPELIPMGGGGWCSATACW